MTVNTFPPRRYRHGRWLSLSATERVEWWVWEHARWLLRLRCRARRAHRVKFGSHGFCVDCGDRP